MGCTVAAEQYVLDYIKYTFLETRILSLWIIPKVVHLPCIQS